MRNSLKLGRIAGIVIEIHYTWLIVFAFLAWSLAEDLFPIIVPGRPILTYWFGAVLTVVLLFISVLLHEMAHSLVANSRGLNVSAITLFIFGGVSHLQQEPQDAKTEFLMAIAGPLTSLILAMILWGTCLSMGIQGNPLAILTGDFPLMNSLGAALIYYLSSLNLMLALFNLIPAFPLDGGRVLRSLIWGVNKDLTKSTNIAATIGQIFGFALIAYGVFTLVQGDFLGCLWYAFIGWFLASAARASRRQVNQRSELTGVLVKEVMKTNPIIVDSSTMLESVVYDIFLRYHCNYVLVYMNHRPVGLVMVDEVKKVPQDQWTYTSVGQIMTRDSLFSISPEDDLNTAMRLLDQHNANHLLVQKSGELVGLVNRADIIHLLEITRELKIPGNPLSR